MHVDLSYKFKYIFLSFCKLTSRGSKISPGKMTPRVPCISSSKLKPEQVVHNRKLQFRPSAV